MPVSKGARACALTIVAAAALAAATIGDRLGAATGDLIADQVLGQIDFTKAAANFVDATGMDAPHGIAVDSVAGRVYVADTSNSRVLGWASVASFVAGNPADLVVGQPDFNSSYANQGAGAGATTLNQPVSVAIDSAHNLYVADTANNRITTYSDPFAARKATGQTASFAAQVVFGQSGDLMSSTMNDAGVSADSLSSPQGIAIDAAGNLFADDVGNNRILVYFKPLPASAVKGAVGNIGDATADLVFGQGGAFTTVACNASGLSANDQLCFGNFIGVGLALDSGGNLFASDTGNNRALEFNAPFGPGKANSTTANLVFSGSGIVSPSGVAVDSNGNFYVASEPASEILEYQQAIALPNTSTVNLTIGANGFGPTAASLSFPSGLAVDSNNSLYVADLGNNRALQFTEQNPPATKVADGVAGQGPGAYGANAINFVDAIGMNSPAIAAIDSQSTPGHPHLYVADTRNNRVLGWYDISTLTSGQPADLVLGQAGLNGYKCNDGSAAADLNGLGADSMCAAGGVAVDAGGNVYVADTRNNRALIFSDPFAAYSGIRQSGGFKANAVLGQSNFTTTGCASNVTLATLCAPASLALDNAGRLYIADGGNNRVVEFDAPLTSATGAIVIGQATSSGNTCNSGGPGAATLCDPQGVALASSGILYVADTLNNRVLEFDTPLTSQSATRVFGQSGAFNGTKCNAGSATGSAVLCAPAGAAVDNAGRLMVADTGNNRVLEFDPPFATNPAASHVLGQGSGTNFSGNGCAGGLAPSDLNGVGADSLCMPAGVTFDPEENLWVADSGNNRIVEIDQPDATPTPTATPTITATPTSTATSSITVSATATPTGSATATPTLTPTPTPTASPTSSGITLQPGSLLTWSPKAINFGKVKMGKAKSKNIKIKNSGKVNLVVRIVAPASPFGSSSSELTLAYKHSASIPVNFQPKSAGTTPGTLTIQSSDPSHPNVSIVLSGTGAAAK